MTTTTTEPAAPAGPAPEQTLRNLSIAANLLPVEIVQSRRSRAARRGVVTGLVGLVVLLSAWYGATAYQTASVRNDVASAEADEQRLLKEQHKYRDLVALQAESTKIKAQLSALFASDVQVAELVAAIQAAAPAGVRITTVSVVTSGTGAAGITALPTQNKEKVIGTVTVTGIGRDKAIVATYVDSLAKVPGLANVTLGSANLQAGQVDFGVRMDLTTCRIGGRYTKPGACETNKGGEQK